ncbi:hypothetical protein SAMN04487996_101196 [Dyadobacter soli]|uniref:Uncharacterized protein n=1 Tax=Dyadobacter soli TaxID=659014 RepID=A0A1G6VB41_9BACT|nr:hypothetical protein SAMN04487996_101196 [Dyadobacter soli]
MVFLKSITKARGLLPRIPTPNYLLAKTSRIAVDATSFLANHIVSSPDSLNGRILRRISAISPALALKITF